MVIIFFKFNTIFSFNSKANTKKYTIYKYFLNL